MEAVTLIQLIAAITQLLQQGAQGAKAVIDIFSGEFTSFWEEFERTLRDVKHVPFADVDQECYHDPEFKVLVAEPTARLPGLDEGEEWLYLAGAGPSR